MVLESFWRHFGDILETFWYLDGFWRHFGEFLDTFWNSAIPQLDTSTVVFTSEPLGPSESIDGTGKIGVMNRRYGVFIENFVKKRMPCAPKPS